MFFPDQTRPDRAVISISGKDVFAWLHSLLTCDVSALVLGSAAYGALLSPQGKILHDVFVYNDGDVALVDCAAEQCASLFRKLSFYKLRAKLMIEITNDIEVAVHSDRPSEARAFVDPRHPGMGWRSFSDTGTYINVPGSDRYDKRRIELGLADSVGDLRSDVIFPHEANFDQFGGVSFSKGCYVGQEVVSRIQHRGSARSRFLPIEFGKGQPRDAQIASAGKLIGEGYSYAGDVALALIRIDRLAEVTSPLMAGGARVSVMPPDWITYDVKIPEVAR